MILNENHIRQIILQEIQNVMASNPSEFDVRASFDKLNQEFFGNSLPRCTFNMNLKKGYLGFFKYSGKQGNKLINPILSVNGKYQMNSNQLDSIVAHEMIHYFLALSGIDPDCTHGAQFKQMAARMNSQLGLQIDERVDTGAMQYGASDSSQPSQELLAYMNSYMKSLNTYAIEVKNSLKKMNGDVQIFMSNLYTFTTAMVQALRRCVTHKTLNESGALQTPQMVTDFINGYKNARYYTLRFFDDIMRYKNGSQGGGNYYNGNGELALNRNTKLGELIYNVFPNIEKEYNRINNQSANALASIQVINNIFTCVNELKQRIDTERQTKQQQNNAQAQQS